MRQQHASLTTQSRRVATLVGAGLALCAGLAHAGATFTLGDDKSLTLGLGLKTSFISAEKGAANGSSRSKDFNVDSARIYLGASLSKMVKLTLNTEKDADDKIHILDAYGELQFAPEFNVAIGRTIVPSDRANLSGGYYIAPYEFPGVASQFYSKFASRDDGAVVWGKLAGGKFVYSGGAFKGRNRVAGGSNQSSSLLYAGRLAYAFWDAEPAPAYFTGSTYYGGVDVLTLGLVAQTQKDGVGSAAVRDDYTAYGVDLLMEKKLPGGVLTLEGAYSKYDFSTAAGLADVSSPGMQPGKSGLVVAAFLFPEKIGWGKLQPFARYQKFSSDVSSAGDVKQADLGLNYVIDGANTRIVADYRKLKAGGTSRDAFILGLQLQY